MCEPTKWSVETNGADEPEHTEDHTLKVVGQCSHNLDLIAFDDCAKHKSSTINGKRLVHI